MTELRLAAGFPPADRSDWESLVARALGDRPVETLTTLSRDGVALGPLFDQRADGGAAGSRIGAWRVFQRVDHPDMDDARELAAMDLQGGADGLELIFPGSCSANGFGVGAQTLADMERLLDGFDLSALPLRVDGGYESRQVLPLLLAYMDKQAIDPAKLDLIVLSDPMNGLLSDGRLTTQYDNIVRSCADIAKALAAREMRIPFLVADGRAVHAGGGSEAQELAFVLASALQHLRGLERHGIGPQEGLSFLTFTLVADADQFLTVSKLRAFRLLWARILDVMGLERASAHLHAETAWRMMARQDPWSNLLRTSLAVAGAGLGGADSVTILPFTAPLGLPDAFARRIARNTQLVLVHEAGLGDVADPGAGAGYVEAVTDGLCEAAWELFQEIEREGGLTASVMSGRFQGRVEQVRAERLRDVSRLKDVLVGVSEHALLDEAAVRTLETESDCVQESGIPVLLPASGDGARTAAMVAAFAGGASLADIFATVGGDWQRARAVERTRLAEPFEQLRDAAAAARYSTGEGAMVCLANIGSPSQFSARANWARGIFAAGGIAAIAGEGGEDPVAISDACGARGRWVACICGSDAAYDHHARVLAGALKERGARLVYLAGRPGDREEELREAGVDGFLYAGCDVLAELKRCHDALGLTVEGDLREGGPTP